MKDCKGIFQFGVPRGGTNLFCSMMHNHENIVAITQRGTKKFLFPLKETNGNYRCKAVSFLTEDLIYKNGGFYKDFSQVRYILFDKVNWDKIQGFYYLELVEKLMNAHQFLGIVLVRNWISILNSMHNFHLKHNRPGWRLSLENVSFHLEHFFRPQIEFLRNKNTIGVSFESFISELPGSYRDLCKKLNIDFKLYYTDCRESFQRNGTITRGVFEVRSGNEVAGSFYENGNHDINTEPMFFDPEKESYIVGLGGFNPYQKLDVKRILRFKKDLDLAKIKLIRKVFEKSIASRDVKYLFENDVWDPIRLAKIDSKSIGNYHKIYSFLPRIERKVRRLLKQPFRQVSKYHRLKKPINRFMKGG